MMTEWEKMDRAVTSEQDEKLREAVLLALTANGLNSRGQIRVGVVNRVVHLAGKVKSLELRSAAEEFTQQINGVRGVVNRIEAPGAPSPTRIINLALGGTSGRENPNPREVTEE